MDTREKVMEILHEVKPTKDLSLVEDIFEGGYIDSMELMTLISLLDEKFNVEITVDDMIPENFNSVNGIVAMIDSLR